MKARSRTTLRDLSSISGIGVHSALPATVTLHPADENTGIVFVRTDRAERELHADHRAVTATEFATVLGDEAGPFVSTPEHLLAALRGLGVDDVVVEIDGPEVPIMDGSAAPFVAAIDHVGLETLSARRRYIEVLKPVRVRRDDAFGELRPFAHGLKIEAEIEFPHPAIGRQDLAVEIDPASFRRDIARARTFGFMEDVARLWSAGYALGASLENTIVVNGDRVLNPGGLRFADEFVRHKILDAVGDLALAGAPLLAAYRTVRGGHRLNYAVLSALMADTTAWRWAETTEMTRRIRGHAEIAGVAPAFGPDRS
jgi:UDP-3-O-[3-hydroxymyristoyl] N-acetylglucosamine deacetylase